MRPGRKSLFNICVNQQSYRYHCDREEVYVCVCVVGEEDHDMKEEIKFKCGHVEGHARSSSREILAEWVREV